MSHSLEANKLFCSRVLYYTDITITCFVNYLFFNSGKVSGPLKTSYSSSFHHVCAFHYGMSHHARDRSYGKSHQKSILNFSHRCRGRLIYTARNHRHYWMIHRRRNYDETCPFSCILSWTRTFCLCVNQIKHKYRYQGFKNNNA